MKTHALLFCMLLSSLIHLGSTHAASAPQSDYVRESAREIPVAYDVDVVVVGGSSGAVATAMSAAQQGAKVFLAAPRPYLGEDLCGSYQLWLEPGEVPDSPLAIAMYAAPEMEAPVQNRLPLTYTADIDSSDPHRDTAHRSLLTDGKWLSASTQSVQYNGDVTLVARLADPTVVQRVSVMAYQRNSDFEVADVQVDISVDGRQWTSVGTISNERVGEGGFERQALQLSLPLDRRVQSVRFIVRKTDRVSRILLGEICLEGKALEDSRVEQTRVAPTLMQVKRVLDQALLAHKVQFLYGCYPTEVLRDRDGKLAGIVMVNRSGRQAVKAKVIVDATGSATVAHMAQARFTRRAPDAQTFKRIVIGGQQRVGSPAATEKPSRVMARDGALYRAHEYPFSLTYTDLSFASLAALEQNTRDRTWRTGQVHASENLWFVWPQRLISRGATCSEWSGASALDVALFRPQHGERLFVVSECADVSHAVAEVMSRPLERMRLGKRIGSVAAYEAARVNVVKPITVQARTLTSVVSPGDVRDDQPWAPPAQHQLGTLRTEDRAIKVLGSYDVVVMGGGTAGAPAGIAAARQGAKTLVVEYLHDLGGIGTAGLITKYYHGNRTGFTQEIDAGLGQLGGEKEAQSGTGQAWDPWLKSEWFRRELRNAGAHIWYGVLGCGAFVDQDQVKGVVVATPQGRGVVLAKVVIDSTGHGGVAAAAGAQCIMTGPAHIAIQGTGLPPRDLGKRYTNTDYTFVDDSDVFDVWRVFVTSRQKFKGAYDLGQLIDTRERRQIEGDFFLTPLDAYAGRTFPDTIVQANSNFDTHGFTIHSMFMLKPPDRSSIPTSVPYRCLLPKGLEGILVTGLGVSAHRDVMPVIRMQPDVQNQGYAAGVAGAMAVQAQAGLREIDIKALQRHLVRSEVLTPDVVDHQDSFPLPAQAIEASVKTVVNQFEGLEVLFTQPRRARRLLREAYVRAEKSSDRFTYAHILGIMGDPSGAQELAEAVDTLEIDEGWSYRGMGQFGPSLSYLDSLVIALGRTRAPVALSPVLNKVRELGPQHAFSHHRAVAMALEIMGRKEAAPVLASLLKKPGMSNHAFTDIEMAHQNIKSSSTDNSTREESLRELVLARALYRCGDSNGMGERILKAYANDLRGHYRRHAQAILAEDKDRKN